MKMKSWSKEYIKGREFSVAVVDGKAYPIIEIAPLRDSMIIRINIRPALRLRPVPPKFHRNSQKMQHYVTEAGAKESSVYGRMLPS